MRVDTLTQFWAAALVMFFGTFRKSNLLPNNVEYFNPEKQFVRSDFIVMANGLLQLNVIWSKTNHFKWYSHTKKLYRIYHMLCPVAAVNNEFHTTPLPAPAFVIDRAGTPMTGKWFNHRFKALIRLCGLDPKHLPVTASDVEVLLRLCSVEIQGRSCSIWGTGSLLHTSHTLINCPRVCMMNTWTFVFQSFHKAVCLNIRSKTTYMFRCTLSCITNVLMLALLSW